MLKRPSGPLPSTSSSTLSGSGYSSCSTRTPDVSASCADAVTSYVCFKCSFLWSSIIASVIFAVVDFFSAEASKVSAIMVSLVVSNTADVSVDTALVSVDTSLVSENTVLVLESRALVSGDTALVTLFPCPWSFHRCGYCTGLLSPCGGDYTGAVLVLSGYVFCRCRGILYITSGGAAGAVHLKDVDFPVVAQRFFSHGPDFSAFPYFSPSCRTRSGCPGCAVASSATGTVLSMNVAVLAQRQVPAALCTGWAPGPFIDLSVGSV